MLHSRPRLALRRSTPVRATRLVFSAAALLACALAGAQDAKPLPCGVSSAQLERVRQIDAEVVQRGHAPGIVTMIHCEGQPLLTHAQGLADAARSRAIAVDDLFRIYSMSKPVTSVAALMLAVDGKLKLDDPVSRFIPEFGAATVFGGPDTPAGKLARPVTVRDLMRHTAGVTYRGGENAVQKAYVAKGIDNGGGAVVSPEDGSEPVSGLADMARRIATVPLMGQPGERFTYGNATDVLGRVVEVASGQPLGTFLAQRIFEPLGMHDTAFQVPAAKTARLTAAYWAKSATPGDNNILKGGATGLLGKGSFSQAEDPTKSVFSRPRSIAFGGAGLVSTAADYQRFLNLLMNRGMAGDKRIVSEAMLAEMTRNQLPASALATPQLQAQGLGFGLGVATIADPARAPVPVSPGVYFWGGAASTYFWVDPERRISGVVMTQVFGGNVSAFYLDMLRALYPAPVTVAHAK